MAYDGPEYYYVIYKAVGDFSGLMRDAAQAKAALQGMQDAVKAETAAEVQGATQAAAAREKDIASIRAEAQALSQLEQAARQTNTQLLYGGRNDMSTHLADLAKELEYTTLLNRQRWLGFSSVQQAMSYRQQMYQLALLENKAHFAGYLTADQYLGFLQREIAQTSSLSAAIRARTAAIGAETSALLAHANALQGTSQTAGQLGEQLTPTASFAAYAAMLTGLPDEVVTRVSIDDSQAMADLAAYRAVLAGLPHTETTDIIAVATRMGGVTLDRPQPVTERVPLAIEAVPAQSRDFLKMLQGQQYEMERAGQEARLLDADLAHLNEHATRLNVDFSELESARNYADDLEGVLTGLVFERVTPGVELEGGAEAIGEVDYLAEMMATLGREKIHPRVEFEGVAPADGELAALIDEVSMLDRPVDTVINVDASGAVTSVEELRNVLDEVAVIEGRVVAGMGGPSGGGGGGGPPPPRPPTGGPPGDEPDPRDTPAWRQLADELDRVDAMFARTARTAAAAGSATRTAAKDAAAFVDPLVASTAGWFGLNSQLRVFGGLLPGAFGTVAAWHVVLDFIIEFLAVFVPAITTAIAGLAAFGIAGSDAAKQVYARLQAIHVAADATGQSIAPLTGNLEKLHDQVRPMVWEIYGDAIDIARGKTGLFNRLATDTGTALDRMAARITVDLTRSGSGLNTFLRIGEEDLAKLGVFFHNVGLALLTFIRITQETHIDQIFLNFFVVLSQLLVLVTKLPAPLLAVAVGLHAFWLWGGLAVTAVLQLLNPLRSLALALGAVDAASVAGGLANTSKDASAFTRMKAGLTDIGAGLAAVPGRLNVFTKSAGEAQGAAVGLAGAAEGAAKSGGGIGAVFGGMAAALGGPVVIITALVAALAAASLYLGLMPDQTRKWTTALGQAVDQANTFTVVGKTVSNLAAVTQTLAVAQKTGAGNATELAASQADLNTRLGEETKHVGEISRLYGTDFVGALALLNTAGVKTSDIFTHQADTWAYAKQQVDGLVQGYKAMGQGLSAVQQDVSVQLVTTSDQLNAMNKLNQAWDTFQGLVSAPIDTFLSLDQSVNTFLADASASGATMLGLGTDILTVAGQTKTAAPQISNAAIALQQQFQTVYANVQKLFDAFRTAQAVNGGQGDFTKFVKDAVAALIPLAGTNQAAAAEISQLAQEAGGPGTISLKELAKWAGSVKDPMLALYNASEQATKGTADLSQDAQRLTSTLQQDLTPAMANAIFQAQGGQKPFSDFSDALKSTGANSQYTISAAHRVARELLAIAGSSQNAKADFIGFMEAQGLSAKQAEQLWREATGSVQGSLAAVRDSVGHTSKSVKDDLGGVRDGLAKTATSVQQLGTPGLWGQIEHQYMAKFDQMRQALIGFGHNWEAHWDQMIRWFGDTVPQHLEQAWNAMWRWFTTSFKSWLDETGTYWEVKWLQAWHGFLRIVYNPLHDFFTNDIPSWWEQLSRGWLRLWSDAWTGFNRNILQPIEHFFTATLPNAMTSGIRTGIDSVIGGLNTVIGWINDVTSVVGVHIGTVPKLAAGGSVPGTGDEDGTHIVAMGGEYMLRKPARMALQAAYGPEFLDYLNQADAWLGSGSRGNAASQRASHGGRYAGGGGILGDIGSWLGSVAGDVESLAKEGWHGVSGIAGDVAKWGEKAVFDAMWDTTGRPFAAGLSHDGTPGALAAGWLTGVHSGVENWLAGKTQAANSLAMTGGPGGGVPAANAALARRLKPDWGSGVEWASWNDLEMREAGWNQFATNPTSGAYGIPQALPPTKMPFAAQRAGGSNPTAQIEWMISYITSVYGDPVNADAHERGYHWYAAGGPVTSAIRSVTPDHNQREAMALGSYLLTRWNPDAVNRPRDEYGAWLIDLKAHKGFTAKKARDAYDSAKLLAPYYNRAKEASPPGYWRVHPELAALKTYEMASTAARTFWSVPEQALLSEAWSQTRAAFPPPHEKLSRSISGRDVAEWSRDAARMWPAWEDALRQWHDMERFGRPSGKHGMTPRQWKYWLSQRKEIAAVEGEAAKVIAPLFRGLHDPPVLKASMFTDSMHAVDRWAAALQQAQFPDRYHHRVWNRAETDLHKLHDYIGGAGHAWQGLYGQYLVPGIKVHPPGEKPVNVDLNKLITGFPFGQGGSGGGDFGFAAGGPVPQLSDVASMFSGSMTAMASGGIVPSLFVPGLSATLTRQLSAQAAGQLPRTLADGAASKTGLHVDQLTINNPKPEKPSDSITRASNRLAFLGGRGMV